MSALPIDSYARRSVGFDDEYADNEDLQHESNEAGIRRLGREIGARLADGISAWKVEAHRKDWHLGIDRMVAGVSGGMAVWRSDRFTRQMYELEVMFRRLDDAGRKGCVLVSMGMVYELDNPMARRMLRMETIQSQGSSDTTSYSSRQTLARQREEGVWNGAGKRVFGFPGGDMLAKPTEGFGKEKRRPLVDQTVWRFERDAVQKAYAWVLEGVSTTEVARRWNRLGLTGTMGSPWNPITVRQVLCRPLNCGRIVHKGEVVGRATNVDPIVDEETFDRVQAIFAGRRRGRKITGRFLASGIVKCGRCGSKLMSRPQWRGSGRSVPSYRCSEQYCGLSILQAPLNAWLREFTVTRLSDPVAAKRISAVQLGRDSEIVELTTQLSSAREDRSALTRIFATGGMDRADWEDNHAILSKRVGELEARLEELRAASADVATVHVESREEVEREWDAAEAEGDIERQRQMLKDALHDFGEIRIRPNRKGMSPNGRVRLVSFG